MLERFSYVSTAGGAFLEWLEGKELPGVAVLRQGEEPPQIVVHDLEQARAALAAAAELGCAIRLRSAPGPRRTPASAISRRSATRSATSC